MSDNKDKVITESIGLLKEIISEMDCRDKVRKYLDSLEIPDRFFVCMFGELVKIFGTMLFEPNPYYCYEPNPYYCYDAEEQEKFVEGGAFNNKLPYPKDYSYRDQIDTELTYEGGTGGWYNAFKTTCWILNMEWLFKTSLKIDSITNSYHHSLALPPFSTIFPHFYRSTSSIVENVENFVENLLFSLINTQ